MLALLAALAGLADAAALGPITDPQWENLSISSRDLQAYFPQAAIAKAVDGAAVIECRVAKRGSLEDCKVLVETPAGLQFGEAALRLSAMFHMKPTTRSGQPVEGRLVRLPIAFNLPWTDRAPAQRGMFTVYGGTQWVRKPTGEDIARVYPDRALRLGLEGRATMQCQISTIGTLTNCAVAEQAPDGANFGAAALALAPLFRLDVSQGAGLQAPGQTVKIPIRFQLPRS